MVPGQVPLYDSNRQLPHGLLLPSPNDFQPANSQRGQFPLGKFQPVLNLRLTIPLMGKLLFKILCVGHYSDGNCLGEVAPGALSRWMLPERELPGHITVSSTVTCPVKHKQY